MWSDASRLPQDIERINEFYNEKEKLFSFKVINKEKQIIHVNFKIPFMEQKFDAFVQISSTIDEDGETLKYDIATLQESQYPP